MPSATRRVSCVSWHSRTASSPSSATGRPTRSLLLSETLEHIESESLLKPDDLIIVVGGGFDARTGAKYLEIGAVEQMKSRNRLPAIG